MADKNQSIHINSEAISSYMSCDVCAIDPIRVGSLNQKELYYLVEPKSTSKLQRSPLLERFLSFEKHELVVLIFELFLDLNSRLHRNPSELVEEDIEAFKAASCHSDVEWGKHTRGFGLGVGKWLVKCQLTEISHN